MYGTHFVINAGAVKQALACTCVSAIKPDMHTMNAVNKKSY